MGQKRARTLNQTFILVQARLLLLLLLLLGLSKGAATHRAAIANPPKAHWLLLLGAVRD
jgi:hypothetical protein